MTFYEYNRRRELKTVAQCDWALHIARLSCVEAMRTGDPALWVDRIIILRKIRADLVQTTLNLETA